jgi:alginate O-acetyltransferase complex protein AlgJ
MVSIMGNSPIHKVKDGILISMFVGSIWLPLVGFLGGWENSEDLGEKRTLSKCPVLGADSLETIPEKFDSFYKDHFGFRNDLIRGHNWIRYKLFKGETCGDVLIGKDGWLFLTKAGIISDYLGQRPLTPEELARWKAALERRQRWLAERGIRYLFVVAPNKAMIYSEMLPDHIYMNKHKTRVDQLVNYLSETSKVEFLDLRDALIDAKATSLVYHPRDSHWNERGAFVVYREICNRLVKWFPDICPWSIEDFTITIEKQVGDLATMLGLGGELILECEVFNPRKERNAYRVNLTLPNQHPWPKHIISDRQVAMENKNAKHRLLFLHDSFGNHGGLQEYISEHFSRSAFVPVPLDLGCLELMVEQECPDVVIEEIAERKLIEVPSIETDWQNK